MLRGSNGASRDIVNRLLRLNDGLFRSTQKVTYFRRFGNVILRLRVPTRRRFTPHKRPSLYSPTNLAGPGRNFFVVVEVVPHAQEPVFFDVSKGNFEERWNEFEILFDIVSLSDSVYTFHDE